MVLTKRQKYDILIIDDDIAICEILKEYCIKMGCFKSIVLASDGIMANLKLRNQIFSVILLDMNLPKRAGLDVLNDFNEDSLNNKDSVLIISGTLDKDIIAKIHHHGVKYFLVKPFAEHDFQEKVLKIIVGVDN